MARAHSCIPSMIVSGLLVLPGCLPKRRLHLPISDPTPPTASLSLRVSAGQDPSIVNTASGPARWFGGLDASVELLASGRDEDGGVKELRIDILADVSCTSTMLNIATENKLMPISRQSVEAAVGDEVRRTLVVHNQLDAKDIGSFLWMWHQRYATDEPCGHMTFVGRAVATAENYYGGVVQSPEITIEIHTTGQSVRSAAGVR